MSDICVVIPCFNLGRTLPAALDSIAAQTRSPSEVVVVDDGSTDLHTRQLLAGLDMPGARVIRTPNRGLAAARNRGIISTSAAYIVTLDGDDCLTPTYLERTGEVLDGSPTVGFVTTAFQAFGDAHYVWTPPPCSVVNAFTRGAAHPASLFRRVLWQAVGGFDEITPIHGCEDLDFWVSAMLAGYQGLVIDEPLFRYRIRRDSMHQSNVATGRHATAMEALLRKHEAAIRQIGPVILLEKERFRLEQLRYLTELGQRQAQAADRIGALEDASPSGGRPVPLGVLTTSPVSSVWGLDRGTPIDRYYIRAFLERRRADIKGIVLEVKDSGYADALLDTSHNRHSQVDVLDVDPTNARATVIADLTRADSLPQDRYDCFILTQTLHMIFDIRSAVANAMRLLKPEGVLLCTIPAVSRVDYESGLDTGDYWRLTEAAVRRLFAEVLPVEMFTVETHGNPLVCAAFLYGLAVQDLNADDLALDNPWFPLVHCVRAVRPSATRRAAGRSTAGFTERPTVLMYHRVCDSRNDPFRLSIDPERFREQMRLLRDHCEVLTLPELAAAAKCGTIPPKGVAITFDDAYVDNLSIAAPILKEFGLPAIFFATTAPLERPQEFWWDTLARLLFEEQSFPDQIELSGVTGSIRVSTSEERQRTFMLLHPRLRGMTAEQRGGAIGDLVAQLQRTTRFRRQDGPMTAAELQQLATWTEFRIGAHTVSHPRLSQLDTEAQLAELSESKSVLERILARPIDSVAYPYGDVAPQTASLARACGFTIGLGVTSADDPRVFDVMNVARVDASALSASELERLISGH
jgi:peptidoglycan/xylan/chitin deacetylase (PgdA/CDA1 family)/GT2 family glycosyltransferase